MCAYVYVFSLHRIRVTGEIEQDAKSEDLEWYKEILESDISSRGWRGPEKR